MLSGCTQVNRPVSKSVEPPSTGKALVRGENEPSKQTMPQKTMAESMNQCQDLMKQSLNNPSNNPNFAYDKQYIDTLIQHHQGAIQMAEDAKQKAEHTEVRQLAEKMIETEQKEIEKLKDWRQKWYGAEPKKSARG
ncbi:DUF305 domain-containing protein [Vampirovibrio chlorellavorus]|uniref:DUF305 domain-containing protein n=1 Tax=Vampirovibrio chlorellavorus TaxID=758823 RepID=UPI0026F2DF6D|nr:DUF305 domain-containing protein [Vampirovibrio chlorellavorus]